MLKMYVNHEDIRLQHKDCMCHCATKMAVHGEGGKGVSTETKTQTPRCRHPASSQNGSRRTNRLTLEDVDPDGASMEAGSREEEVLQEV